MVTDRDTGASKGYGFCEYADPSITDLAILVRGILLVLCLPFVVLPFRQAEVSCTPVLTQYS